MDGIFCRRGFTPPAYEAVTPSGFLCAAKSRRDGSIQADGVNLCRKFQFFKNSLEKVSKYLQKSLEKVYLCSFIPIMEIEF